jgi:hypothetical protein
LLGRDCCVRELNFFAYRGSGIAMTEHQARPLSETAILKAISAAPIPQAAVASIARHVAEIGFAIERERFKEPNRTPETRRDRRKHLRKMSGRFAELITLMSKARPDTRNSINDLLAEPAGTYLSIQAFESIGISIDTSVSIHVLSSREATSREGPYRALDTEVATSRRSAAARTAHSAIASFLERLKRRIDLHLDLMRDHKGGNPGNAYRRFAIRQLASAYRRHVGSPTMTVTGRFMKLCEKVLPLLGIELRGLERAVERELKKRQNK